MRDYDKELLAMADIEQAKRRNLYGVPPAACDFCSTKIDQLKLYVDGAVHNTFAQPKGAWAYMCPKCFSEKGIGVIAYGKGQLYMKQNNAKWLMIAGYPPPPTARDRALGYE